MKKISKEKLVEGIKALKAVKKLGLTKLSAAGTYEKLVEKFTDAIESVQDDESLVALLPNAAINAFNEMYADEAEGAEDEPEEEEEELDDELEEEEEELDDELEEEVDFDELEEEEEKSIDDELDDELEDELEEELEEEDEEPPPPPPKKKPVKKSTKKGDTKVKKTTPAKRTPAKKKPAEKKSPAKVEQKKVAAKSGAKKPVAKKPTPKKTTAKKQPAKKTTAKATKSPITGIKHIKDPFGFIVGTKTHKFVMAVGKRPQTMAQIAKSGLGQHPKAFKKLMDKKLITRDGEGVMALTTKGKKLYQKFTKK